MARKPRIHYVGAIYHVILRGNHRETIFFSKEDRNYFYSLLEEIVRRFACRIHCFCLMTNHIHMTIQVADISLSRIMQNLAFRYTQRINKLHGLTGHLFQGRYNAILIDADEYMLELTRYIHLNPIRANLVESLEDYPWSSHRAYLGLENIPWLTTQWILGQFGNTHQVAINKYQQFIYEKMDRPPIDFFTSGNQRGFSILSDDLFLEKLQKIPLSKITCPMKLEQLVQLISNRYSIDASMLALQSRSHEFSKIRAIIAWLAKELGICTYTEVANYFKRDVTGLIHAIRKIAEDLTMLQEVQSLKNQIENSEIQA